MATPLRPPRMTGDPATDSAAAIEYLWLWYRNIIEEQEFVRTDDVDESVVSDPQLAAIAALVPSATDNLPYFTAEETATLAQLTSLGRSLIAKSTTAEIRALLSLGALALLGTVSTGHIDDDAVTYAKIQNVSATDKLLGRSSSGSGNVEEIDCTAAGRALLDDANASAQRTTLGLAIGTDVQAYDATLAALAALTIAANSLTIGTGADAFSQTSFAANTFPARASTGNLVAKAITDFALSLLDDADAATMQATLGLVPGTNVQAYDAELAALAGLTSAADKVPYFTGSGAAALADFTAGGRALVGATSPETIVIAVSDETTAITTGTAKISFRMPFAMTLASVRASLATASSSGNPAIDINEEGVSIFSTTLTIDSGEKTSTTAATPAVLSDTALADDAEITIDIDTAGTGAKGLKVYLIGRRT